MYTRHISGIAKLIPIYQVHTALDLEQRINHLQTEYDHLNIVREYHFWAKGKSQEPRIQHLHQAVAEKINETMEQLALLIEALKKSDDPQSQKSIV